MAVEVQPRTRSALDAIHGASDERPDHRSRWAFLRVIRGAEAKLLLHYLRPKLPTIGLIAVMGTFSTAVEALRLVVLFSTLQLIAGEASGAAGASLFGLPLELPIVSDLGGLSGLIVMLSLLAAATAVKEGVDFAQNALSYRVQGRLMFEIRHDIFEKTLALEPGFFAGARAGDLGYLQTSIIDRFTRLVPTARMLIQWALDLAVTLLVLAVISLPLTALAIVTGLVYFTLSGHFRKRVRGYYYEFEVANRAASTHFLDLVGGIRLVKLGGQKRHVEKRYFDQVRQAISKLVRNGVYDGLARAVTRSGVVVVVLVLALGMKLLSELSTGEAIGFLALSYRAASVLQQLTESQFQLNTMVPNFLMVARFLLDNRAVERSRRKAFPRILPIRDSIAADNLSFSYVPGTSVLSNISARFETGTATAIVGSSGSGKTTLMEILAGYRPAPEGKLLVDSEDLSRFDVDSYREQVGYVTQDPTIFHDTVRNNLTFLNPEASDRDIERAISRAAADDFIGGNGRGLDSVLGERGLKISGGQRQRIALARVLLQDPPVLLLDEATNGLDLYIEARVFANLLEIRHRKIVAVIAHRLSAITRFDAILVLHQGKIVEEGTHDELIAERGRYFHLYELQQQNPEESLAALEAL